MRPKKITKTTHEMPNMTNKIFLNVNMVCIGGKVVPGICSGLYYKVKVMAETLGVSARRKKV